MPLAEDRYERKGLAFHTKLREGFLDILRRNPKRCRLVDAAQDVDAVAEDVWSIVERGALMAEEFKDPREVAWHPRRAAELVGHKAAEARLLQAHQSGKLHHAWLISGPQGIGKATLAYRFAKFLLQVPIGGAGAGRTARSTSRRSSRPSARWRPAPIPACWSSSAPSTSKHKRLKTEIAVDDAREAQGFFGQTAAAGGWRVAIVDPADELNAASANALLKLIEEPPKQSIFLIVCHQPGRLLRTIRSRCLHLPLEPLSIERDAGGAARPSGGGGRGGGGGHPPGRRTLPRKPGPRDGADRLAGVPRPSPNSSSAPSCRPPRRSRSPRPSRAAKRRRIIYIFCDLLVGWTAEQARAAGLAGRGEALAARA